MMIEDIAKRNLLGCQIGMNENKELTECLQRIKADFESAILTGGEPKAKNLIRSHKVIARVHEYLKHSLVKHRVNAKKIYPTIGTSKPEITMFGYLKKKKQDITIMPDTPVRDIVRKGIFQGQKDPIGKNIMQQSISINIRSQLSSLGKNFDTLYERTFAEPLNLHLRAPKLIMGEVYMVPLVAYDPKAMQKKQVEFKEKLPFRYIPAFQMISKRSSTNNHYKYERIALLIVDFREDPPKVITGFRPLISMGIVSKVESRKYEFNVLSIRNFILDILSIYEERHGSIDPLK